MKHQGINNLLWQYIAGELEPEDNRNIEHHMENCKDCNDETEKLKNIEKFFAAQKLQTPEEGFFEKVSERLKSGNNRREIELIRHKLVLMTRKIAAVVLIGLVAGVLIVRWSNMWKTRTDNTESNNGQWAYETIMNVDEISNLESYLSDNSENNENNVE